jgi:hypothetical protein
MAIQKLTNIKEVLRKCSSDFGFTDSPLEFPWQDAIEWIGGALEQIGGYNQYEKKEKTITIADHKGKLPCDLYQLIRVVNSTANAYDNLNSNLISNPDNPSETSERVTSNKVTDYDYNIVFDNILTSYKIGEIKIQYLAIPTDDEGFPLVPDMESYKEALSWRVARQLALRDQLPNKKISYELANSQWQWYCGQARAESNVLNKAGRDKVASNFLSFFPLGNSFRATANAIAVSSF